MKRAVSFIRDSLLQISGYGTGVLFFVLFPLWFHDAFFDINRCKVNLVWHLTPVFLLIFILGYFLAPKDRRGMSWSLLLPALLLLLVMGISCLRQGFDMATLTGSEGRHCGLQFWACAIAAMVILSGSRVRIEPLLYMAVGTGAAVAVLGLVNALGRDPLGFYREIQKGQETMFLSTIGHFDFYGTYLVLIFALSGGLFVGGKGLPCILSAVAAPVLVCGAVAARTDSVVLGLGLALFALVMLSGKSGTRLWRALLLCGEAVLILTLLPPALVAFSRFRIVYDSLYLLFTKQMGIPVGLSFLAAAGLAMTRRGKRVPSLLVPGMIFFGICALALVLLMIRATRTGSPAMLRLDDGFGSRRGYIWIRAVRAYRDYGPMDRLFGKGLDLTRRITRAYVENAAEERLSGGVYNDVHCQPLQLLLTCGALGMSLFLAHYLEMLLLTLRGGEEDGVILCLGAAMVSYLAILAINVTQPILIGLYMALSGLALCRVQQLRDVSDG